MTKTSQDQEASHLVVQMIRQSTVKLLKTSKYQRITRIQGLRSKTLGKATKVLTVTTQLPMRTKRTICKNRVKKYMGSLIDSKLCTLPTKT